MSIRKMTKVDGLTPNKWTVVKVADIGANEEFVSDMLEIDRLVGATMIFDQQRKDLTEAVTAILIEGLCPAFLELQQIRASVGRDMPLMNRQQLYEDLARKLWKSYKELLEKAARCLDFKIGFLFDNDKKFEEGLADFRKQNPTLREPWEGFLRATRENWQNDLATFRNKWLEHPVGDRRKFEKFYTSQYAESLFDAVWRTIIDILVPLLELRMSEWVRVVEQHPDDPEPKWGYRFRFEHTAFMKSE
jgi:hypothetical protein